MGNFVEQNLNKNEQIVKKAEFNAMKLVMSWVFGILFFWLLFIPLIKAIMATFKFLNTELAITNKRVIGKGGGVARSSLDAPLGKIQNASVSYSFWGKIFNYGEVQILTAAGGYDYSGVKNAEAFKRTLMAQIDQAEEDRIKEQAEQMAAAMSAAIKKD